MNAEQRRDPRFSMQRNESIDAELLVSNASESRIPGRVVDISRRGAKFEFDGTLPSDDSALLRLKCEKVNWEVEIPGTIHWKHPNRSDGWWVGCSFQKAVQPVALERLASAGIIDRRSEDRRTINTDVQVKLELREDQQGARLVDISHGGFKLWLPRAVNAGERIVLTCFNDLKTDFKSVGRTCWTKSTGDGFFVGCSFVHRDGYQNLMQAMGLQTEASSPVLHRPPKLVQTLSLAAGIAAVAFGIHQLLNF